MKAAFFYSPSVVEETHRSTISIISPSSFPKIFLRVINCNFRKPASFFENQHFKHPNNIPYLRCLPVLGLFSCFCFSKFFGSLQHEQQRWDGTRPVFLLEAWYQSFREKLKIARRKPAERPNTRVKEMLGATHPGS